MNTSEILKKMKEVGVSIDEASLSQILKDKGLTVEQVTDDTILDLASGFLSAQQKTGLIPVQDAPQSKIAKSSKRNKKNLSPVNPTDNTSDKKEAVASTGGVFHKLTNEVGQVGGMIYDVCEDIENSASQDLIDRVNQVPANMMRKFAAGYLEADGNTEFFRSLEQSIRSVVFTNGDLQAEE